MDNRLDITNIQGMVSDPNIIEDPASQRPQDCTSIPSATPTPEELAAIFPPPVLDPNGGYNIRLTSASNYDYEDRADNVPPLCSRDIHPFGVSTASTVIVPADAEVMIVDTSIADNAGLGNFVAVRIPVVNLPEEIRDLLTQNVTDNEIATLIENEIGYLYIGYGHLSAVTAPRPNGSSYPTITASTVIGNTGSTGLDPSNPQQGIHLDVSTYYISGPYSNNIEANDPRPNVYGGMIEPFNSYFGMFETPEGNPINFGKIELIDPVTLWPILAEDINDPIDTTC